MKYVKKSELMKNLIFNSLKKEKKHFYNIVYKIIGFLKKNFYTLASYLKIYYETLRNSYNICKLYLNKMIKSTEYAINITLIEINNIYSNNIFKCVFIKKYKEMKNSLKSKKMNFHRQVMKMEKDAGLHMHTKNMKRRID